MSEGASRSGSPLRGFPGALRRSRFRPLVSRRALMALLAPLLLCTALILSALREAPLLLLEGGTMGTRYSLQLPELPAGVERERLAAGLQARLDHLDKAVFSTWVPDSELSRLNRAPVGEALPLSPDMLAVLRLAADIHALSGGAFDVTVGSLVDLWGFGPVTPAALPPTPAELTAALQSVNADALELDPAARTLRKRAAVQIDLSAIAKGYAADAVAAWLEAQGLRDYLLEIGGELRARGERARGEPWRIAVERPDEALRRAATIVAVPPDGLALAASGDYRNFFEVGGERFAHLLDPRTGRPVAHELAAVGVLDGSAARADALATALLVLGPEAGAALAGGLDLPAYFIMRRAKGLVSRSTGAFDRYLQETPRATAGVPSAREED